MGCAPTSRAQKTVPDGFTNQNSQLPKQKITGLIRRQIEKGQLSKDTYEKFITIDIKPQ